MKKSKNFTNEAWFKRHERKRADQRRREANALARRERNRHKCAEKSRHEQATELLTQWLGYAQAAREAELSELNRIGKFTKGKKVVRGVLSTGRNFLSRFNNDDNFDNDENVRVWDEREDGIEFPHDPSDVNTDLDKIDGVDPLSE